MRVCRVCGDKGRWKQNLIAKCLREGKAHDDVTVSPVVRQTLLHWAYELSAADFASGARRVKTHGATYVKREELAGVMKPAAKPAKGGAATSAESAEVAPGGDGGGGGGESRRSKRARDRGDHASEEGASATGGGATPAKSVRKKE